MGLLDRGSMSVDSKIAYSERAKDGDGNDSGEISAEDEDGTDAAETEIDSEAEGEATSQGSLTSID